MSDVRQIQTFLVSLGATIAVDGTPGPATTLAISAFQSAHGLTADGIWGPDTETAARLLGLDGGPLPAIIEGVDVSAYCCDSHGRSLINWFALEPRPRFMWARSSFNTTPDGSSQAHIKDAELIGAKCGTYHFFGSGDPIAQAKAWFAASGPQPANSTLKPAIDIENNRAAPLTPTESLDWATRSRVLIMKAEELFKRELLIYINPKTAFELRDHLDTAFWGRHLLWLSAYTKAGAVKAPYPWTSFDAHQWAGDVSMPGAKCMMDRNAVFGEDSLKALLQ